MAAIKRGRPPLPKGHDLVPVRIFVKRLNLKKAIKECAAVAARYR